MVCSLKEGIEMVLGLSGLQQVPTQQRSDRARNCATGEAPSG